ncbi:MAG: molybdopterin-dependent oxidoreductase [Chloroflexi bacterium]|nr:molybdopterin-dependent oxidoreductase [Chloroflexota bacterium]
MPRRLTNDLLLGLILLQVLGGVLGWALPVETARPLYDVHRALGVAVILLLAWKQAIALASLRRRLARKQGWDRSIFWGSAAAIALIGTVALGLAWTTNLISFDWLWSYSPLNVHVIIGVALVPFVAWHMLLRRRQNAVSAPIRSRRAFLRVAGLSAATVVGWQAIEHLAPHVRLPTGSKPVGSFNANAFPAEIWLFDSVPLLSPTSWRLNVGGRGFTLSELTALHPPAQVQAVLDCTSGWWSEQVWTGVRLADVLRTAGLESTNVAAVSVTGHRIVLPSADLGEAILATHVGGEGLSPGHGYPLRLIVPGYRGYHWVKWLASLEAA